MNNTNLIRHLRPQIRECINGLMAFGYTHEEILVTLNKRYGWTESSLFRSEKFNYEHATFTLTQLCNLADLFGFEEQKFADDLRYEFTLEAVGIAAERAKETDKPAKGDLAA